MRHALRLAERGLGNVAPNPSVGCVIVSPKGQVVGRGWTQAGGRPHAETVALAQAGDTARGATAYVTLEPCAHHGVTPPCADALVNAGVARVVGAIVDPDPRVAGGGFSRLESAGIAVTRGVLEHEAHALNAGFFKCVTEGRPLVALKIAQSADGYVADAEGNSRWITSERARAHGHLLRARYDAIVAGIGTVLADDPLLTCRLAGLEARTPLRVVFDTQGRLSPHSQLAQTARQHRTLVFTKAASAADTLTKCGVEAAEIALDPKGRPDVMAALRVLAARGITRVLVEGGPALQASFLAASAVDIIHLYRAPLLLGAGGKAAISPGAPWQLATAPRLTLIERTPLGPDVLESFTVEV